MLLLALGGRLLAYLYAMSMLEVETTYFYTDFHLLNAYPDNKVGIEPIDNLTTTSDSPFQIGKAINGMVVEAGPQAIFMGLDEERRYVAYNKAGEERNFRRTIQPQGLVSVGYDESTGLNRFLRAELLLSDPKQIKGRALGSLMLLRASTARIERINVQTVAQLLERIA
jgi:hypothetical protein